MTSPRRTPEEMAADRLEVARRKRAAGEARVARAESEVRAAKLAHYIEVTIDPDGDPDSPYAWDRWDMGVIECSTPGGCGHAEEWEMHGVLHTWRGWTWSIPFDGCPVQEWADTGDLWDGIDGPGRYEVDADWDDTECYLTVVGKVDADNEGGEG